MRIRAKTRADIPASLIPPLPLNFAVQNPDKAPEKSKVISEEIPIIPRGFLNADTAREEINARIKNEAAEKEIPIIKVFLLPFPFFL